MNKKAKPMTNLKWVILISALTMMYSCQQKVSQQKTNSTATTIKVAVKKVTKGSSNNKLSYDGTITPIITTPLSFLLPGTVSNVYVDEGDFVKKGQLLAKIDNTSYLNAYQGTSATQKQAQDAYNRLKTVHDKGSLPAIKWQEVTAKLAQAKSTNQIALQNLNNTMLKAPSNGYIGTRNIEVGTSSISGVPVFNLVAIKNVYVKISVPDNEINQLKKNQPATISIPALGSQLFTGKVAKIGVVANTISKTYDVKIITPNQKTIIKPGMACNVILNTNTERTTISIPYRSVTKDVNGNYFVYKVNSKSKKVNKTPVILGSFINNEIEVVKGVSIGDIIVTEGLQKLSDQAKITF